MYHKRGRYLNIKYTDANMLYAAKLIAEQGYTIRKAAKLSNICKSTLHVWIKKELLQVDSYLYEEVEEVLKKNLAERPYRGGMSTKRKYDHARAFAV